MLSIRAIENGAAIEATTTAGATAIISAETIRRIANKDVSEAFDDVAGALVLFEAMPGGAGAFGGGPGADLAALHEATHGVFTRTVSGVTEDLELFRTNLRRSADHWDEAEQTAVERSANLEAQLPQGVGAGRAAWNQARTDAGDVLTLDGPLADAQAQAAAQEAAQEAAQSAQGAAGNDAAAPGAAAGGESGAAG